MNYTLFDTPLGRCGISWQADGRIWACQLPQANDASTVARLLRGANHAVLTRATGIEWSQAPATVRAAIEGLAALFRGEPRDLLEVPLMLERVPLFHQRVYQAARALKPGQTCSYGEMATSLGDAGAARAVGQALGANPFAPIVPCHRILAAGAKAGGFSAYGGLHTKLKLLELERARFGAQADKQVGLFDAD